MATAVSASYPVPPSALFAGNASAPAAGGTPQDSILKQALTKDLPEYLKEGMNLPGTQEKYEKQFPAIDEGLDGDLKGAAQKFYDAARDSALEIHKNTSEFHTKGYQLIFSIPNGINDIATSTEITYSGLKADLEDLLNNPPDDFEAGFKYFIRRPLRDFKTLSETAKKQKKLCADCLTELKNFKPIIEADKKKLDPVKTAYDAVVPLMKRDIAAKQKEHDTLDARIREINEEANRRLAEARLDPTGGSAAEMSISPEIWNLKHEVPEKQAQIDLLKGKDKKLNEWNTRLLDQETSMDGVRSTIDAAITATETIRGAYETMESHFGDILDSFTNLSANMVKTDPKFQRKGLEDLEEARKQWAEVLEQIKVFIDSKVYQ